MALALTLVALPSPSGASERLSIVDVASAFAPATLAASHPAVTYQRAAVPLGSRVQFVQSRSAGGGDAGDVLVETLRVWGLRSRTRFYAYAYSHRCGSTPSTAGVRVQDQPAPSHFPQNEIWLGFRTNARGDATSSTRQYWLTAGRAESIVIDANPNGDPVACLTVALR